MSNDRLRKLAFRVAGCLVSVMVLLLLIGSPLLPAQHSTQPKITWSRTSTEVLLATDQSTSQVLTFTSNVNLSGIVLEPVPEVAPFLSIQPASFVSIVAGQPEEIQIIFSVPSSTVPGLYSGTVHILHNHRTFPQTLKVSVGVGTSFTNSTLDLSFVIPPVGATPQTQVKHRSDGVTQIEILALSNNNEQPVPELELTLYPNPTSASLHDWFEQNVDVGGVLLNSNAFTVQQLANGPALVLTGSMPTEYQGSPVDTAYALSPSGDAIMSVAESQVNDMESKGYSQQQITDLLIPMLGTVQSF